MEILYVDCSDCVVRRCSQCVMSVLLGVPEDSTTPLALAVEEQQALAVLAQAGLVPPLRLVRAVPTPGEETAQLWEQERFAE